MAYTNTNSFNAASGAAAVTPQITMMQALAPNLKTNVAVDTSAKVDQNKAGAASLAKQNTASLSQTKDDITRVKASMQDVMKQAQGQIIEATKANGQQPGDVFADKSMGPDSAAELVIDVLSAKGGGGFAMAAMKGADKLSLAGDIANNMKDRPQEEVLTAIRETLVASSSSQENESFATVLVDGDETQEIQQSTFDWEKIFEQHPDALEQIMYNPEDSPEFTQLDGDLKQVETAMAEMSAVEVNAADRYSATAVECAELPGCLVNVDDPIVISPELVAKLEAQYGSDAPAVVENLEDDLAKTGAAFTVSSGIGA